MDDVHDSLHSGDIGEARKARRSIPKPRSQARSRQAINDAQQGFSSLLNPHTDDKQPQVISKSGAIRSQKRGRIAGPSTEVPTGSNTPGRTSPLLQSGTGQDERALSIEPATPAWPSRTALSNPRLPGPIGTGASRAASTLSTAREQARLLIGDADGNLGLGVDVHTANVQRRAASQWVTRYATHMVMLLIVGVLVALGGLKTMTVQGAFPRSLATVNSFTGTDHMEDGDSANGKPDHDSPDYQITLPRTDLNGAVIPPAAQQPAPNPAQPVSPAQAAEQRALKLTQYVVIAGDTIESIANKFNIMPETVMGSNGIFDSEEALAPGRQLMIPPIDGMYYVATNGDNANSIAQRFQVDPGDIMEYKPNNVGPDGAVKEGQVLIVPGGMMPEREVAIDYTVRRGDTLKSIAARFGVDVPTMLNSNDIPDPDNLQPGSTLRVLPVPGLEYKIRKGDTILAIAEEFGVSPQMILDYSPNNLTADSKLKIDQVIMVPGGSPQQHVVAAARLAPPAREEPSARGEVRPPERQPVTVPEPPKPSSNSSSASKAPPASVKPPQPKPTPQPQPQPKANNSPKVGTGNLIWPVNGTITQYFSSRHNGLDIAISAGTPIHAADSGKVIWSGWRTDGLGYCVMIDHLNGYTTVYGHMIRQPAVYVGQYVSRGQVIGYVGSTGHSTGPHVHFMVKAGGGTSHAYRNPLAYLGR